MLPQLKANDEIKSGSGLAGKVFYKYFFYDISMPIFITFGSLGMAVDSMNLSDESFAPWGFNFAKRLKLNVLSFSCFEESNWYRCDEFHSWLEENTESLNVFCERLGYGGSMGGYGASAFANILGIDRLLLLNPISTLCKSIAPWETRSFYDAARRFNWLEKYNDGATTKSSGWVIYDPIYELDSRHAKRYQNLKKIILPGVGHQIPKHLQNFGLLKELIVSFIAGEFDSNWFYSNIRKRHEYEHYFNWMLGPQNKHLTCKRKKILMLHQKRFSEEYQNTVNQKLLTDVRVLDRASFYFEGDNLSDSEMLAKIAKNLRTRGTISMEKEEIDSIRDLAVKYQTMHLQVSYELMNLASSYRRGAPFILRKLNEYSKKLSTENAR